MSKERLKVGDEFDHPKYGKYTILERISHDKVVLRFERTRFIVEASTCNVRKNAIRDHKQQLVFGIGKSYSEKYNIRVNKKKTPHYAAWENMLARCYYEKTSRYSAYGGIGVSVCEEWLTYENFAEWYDTNYIEGYHLDKDLIGDGMSYSPENCCYIPQKLNCMFVVTSKNIGRKQSHLPTGIYHHGNGFVSSVHDVKRYFNYKEDAHKDYIKRKWDCVRDLASELYRWTEITERVYLAVVKLCDREQEVLNRDVVK